MNLRRFWTRFANSMTNLDQSELGKKSAYETSYNPAKLFAIRRKLKRDEIGVSEQLPFTGMDLWTHYEVSWLNPKGKPVVAIAEISYPCETPNIIESKSMKLYFNTLNNTKFTNIDEVRDVLEKDLSAALGGLASVTLTEVSRLGQSFLSKQLSGKSLDSLDVSCKHYQPKPDLLLVEDEVVEEVLCSDLLKSNCLVTYQPDWGSVQIAYRGKRINHEGLLKYIVSFRDHNEFHEQCIERIFMDIMRQCQPEKLTVYGRYTRRGGLDINPFRTNDPAVQPERLRLVRQ